MGFKKTSEGRVFFKSPDNDERPSAQAVKSNSEPLVRKDNAQMQILLLLKSLNTKLQNSREHQDTLAQDIASFKETLKTLEEKTLTADSASPKQLEEAQKKIAALEEKATVQESNYICLLYTSDAADE